MLTKTVLKKMLSVANAMHVKHGKKARLTVYEVCDILDAVHPDHAGAQSEVKQAQAFLQHKGF